MIRQSAKAAYEFASAVMTPVQDKVKYAKQHIKRPLGLGDAVHNWLEAVGIGPRIRSYFVEHLQRDCGCNERRKRLNKWCPYKPKKGALFLDVVMVMFEDWEGFWATVQSVLYEAESAGISDRIGITLVDQSPPGSQHSVMARGYGSNLPRFQYHHQENLGSASGKTSAMFRSRGEWSLLLDCHAALKPGSLAKMVKFMEANRFSDDLYGGVIELGAGYQNFRQWIASAVRAKLNGTYDRDDFRQLNDKEIEQHFAHMQYAINAGLKGEAIVDHVLGTDRGYHSHLDTKWQGDTLGAWVTDKRAERSDQPIFEINNLAGWFLFCRAQAWREVNPYHPLMRGFGGEEGVNALAFQKSGRKAFCAPFARASHRFGRAEGAKFRLTTDDRIRNYALAFHSMGLKEELGRMRDYFVNQRPDPTQKSNKSIVPFEADKFDAIVAGAIAEHEQMVRDIKQQQKPRTTLEEMYRLAATQPHWVSRHVGLLRKLSSMCRSVRTLSTDHQFSTVALLAGQPDVLEITDADCTECLMGKLREVKGRTSIAKIEEATGDVDMIYADGVTSEQLESVSTQAKKFLIATGPATNWRHDEFELSVIGNGEMVIHARKQTIESTFERIFANKEWGDSESVSGPGSSLYSTRIVREELPNLFDKLGIKSLLDIPCGDFNWMSRVELPNGFSYIGADIVPALIKQNRERFAGVDFRELNLITDDLPQCDAVLTRDCLVHLPYSEIEKALANIRRSGATWLIATHFPGRINHDIPVGHWRPLDMTAEPISLPTPDFVINEGCEEGGGQFADKSLGVWRLK